MSNKKQKRKRERLEARRAAAENRAAYKRHKRARKAEQKLRRKALAEAALARHESEEKKFARSGVHFQIQRAVLSRARKLIDERYRGGLAMLAQFPWLRPVEDWKPKGKSPGSQFKSLVKHLLVQYSMPEFMYSVFFEEDDDVRRHGIALFVHLGKGGSLYKLVKARGFPVPFTKRMCHVFMNSTAKFGFLEAVRHAQVQVHGGDRRLAEAISSTRQLGRGFRLDEEIRDTGTRLGEDFWDTVIQWTCNQAMLAPGQLAPIYDWIARQRQQNLSFSMKGRTGVSVLRAVEEWHGQLAKERKINGHTYDPSGFDAWYHERKVRLPAGGYHKEKHCITEVTSSKELAAEGRALRHCVYSYSWSIQRGNVSIWSYKVEGERRLTIEVDNRTRRVVQCRGKSNRLPTRSELAQVKKWMQENSLVSAAWLPMGG